MRFRPTFVLAVTVLAAACNDAAGPQSTMTREEALLVAGSVAGSLQQAPSISTKPNDQYWAAAEPRTFTQDVQVTAPCPLGGTADVTWHMSMTADAATGSLAIDANGTHKPAGCMYKHDATTLTVNGDPGLSFEAHLAFANQQPTAPIVVKLNGAFNWAADDGRSGTCSVNYQETTDLVAKSRTRDGTVCGYTIKETLTWT